ncbi:MAG: hypothetical protein PHN38_05860 [Sulfurospirillaceae bacterium]|nr:hypothetical protein [Sulfurospirillaceae bacterium]MDD3462926.1 hypothetical protein [Sulfurospirillaceae bacterium]
MDKIIDLLPRISALYDIPLWIVEVLVFSIVVIILGFPFVVYKLLEPKYKKYKQDEFHNVIWKWQYRGDNITLLWCYCPVCSSALMCDDENCKATSNLHEKTTFFVCNECGGCEKARVQGGDRRYVLSGVKREIMRKIRNSTFQIANKQPSKLEAEDSKSDGA